MDEKLYTVMMEQADGSLMAALKNQIQKQS
jgi:hypothetical protein